MNNLNDFTTEELRVELKRRWQKEKAIKEEERRNAKTCRNCEYLKTMDFCGCISYKCSKRTYTIKKRNVTYNYCVQLSQTCDLFKRKEE